MKKAMLILVVAVSMVYGCAKDPVDQSTVHGTVSYVSFYTSNTEIASGATVKLYSSDMTLEKSTTTNSKGEYSFSNVKDGAHSIIATGTYNVANYKGSGSVSVSGKNNKTVNILME